MKSPYILKAPENRTPQEVAYGNNFERNVYVQGEPLDTRAALRYTIAGSFIKEGMKVLDIGCSSGFGSTLLPKNIIYHGVDYDANIIQLAKENFGDDNHTFEQADMASYSIGTYDVIIAYEFLEHITFGIPFAQMLKTRCDRLFCSVPYNETPGFWGPFHVLHKLTEKDFPDFDYFYISFEGALIDAPQYDDGSNLMLMKWRRK
jgi:SAM-dependent methyltransferase